MRQVEETVQAEIKTSMRDYLAKHPEDEEDLAYCIFFNNFHLKLPFSGRREMLEQFGGTPDEPLVDGGERTCREFYSDLDDLIAERGLNLDKIRILQQEGRRDIHKRKQLLELAFPVYVMLRKLGYTRKELNS